MSTSGNPSGARRRSEGGAAQVLYRLGEDPDGIYREVVALVMGTQDTAVGGAGRAADPPRATTTIRARAAGLVVRARCGVTDEELALPQALRVDLDYLYEAGEGNDLYGALD